LLLLEFWLIRKKVEKAVSITSDAEERRKDSNLLDGITGFTGF
jgi:hypothetical protein